MNQIYPLDKDFIDNYQKDNGYNYSEKDLEQYSEYMEFVYSYILGSSLIKRVKNKMLNGTRIQRKNDETWFITYKDNSLSFMSFHRWFKLKQIQENRASKINQLLNG